jgi:hypothetical protein
MVTGAALRGIKEMRPEGEGTADAYMNAWALGELGRWADAAGESIADAITDWLHDLFLSVDSAMGAADQGEAGLLRESADLMFMLLTDLLDLTDWGLRRMLGAHWLPTMADAVRACPECRWDSQQCDSCQGSGVVWAE